MKFKHLPFALALLMLLAGCAAGYRIVERRGNPFLRERAFTGMSGFCQNERTARDEAMRNALSQVSLFDGVSVNYSYLSQTTEENGKLQDKSASEVALLSKSLFRVIKFEYYLEQSKGPDGVTWQAWCAIPYSDSLRQSFLLELTQLTGQGIGSVENQLSSSVTPNPAAYLDNLQRIWEYYHKAQVTAQAWFTAPNTYTIWLETKVEKYNQIAQAYYRELVLTASPAGVNELTLKATYDRVPYSGVVTAVEKSAVPLAQHLVVTRQNDGSLITVSSLHTGISTLRVYIDKDRFPGVECYRDVTLSMQLDHIFAGKTIGLCCRDNSGARPETANALGKLVTGAEGKIKDLSAYTPDEALLQAAGQGCSYLLIAEVSLSEVRENTQQNLYIAFPALSLRIVDIATRQAVFQTGYPNPSLSDIRGLGKTKAAATAEAYSFGNVLTDKAFLQSFHELRK